MFGLVSGACMGRNGSKRSMHRYRLSKKLKIWNQSVIPIYEPGLGRTCVAQCASRKTGIHYRAEEVLEWRRNVFSGRRYPTPMKMPVPIWNIGSGKLPAHRAYTWNNTYYWLPKHSTRGNSWFGKRNFTRRTENPGDWHTFWCSCPIRSF